MKITLLTPALAAILGLALASAPLPTHAQTTNTPPAAPQKPATHHAIGILSAIDTTGNTISVQNKTDGTRTFAIASTATFVKDKKPATLADFAVGDKVYVTYTKDASGTMTATKLSATTPKPKPAPAATSTTSTPPAAPATTQ